MPRRGEVRLPTCDGRGVAKTRGMLKRVFVGMLAVACAIGVWAQYKVGDKVEVKWGSTWYAAEVKALAGASQWKIGYDGYGENWDEVVGPDRIRVRGASTQATATTAPNTQSNTSSASSGASAPAVPAPQETFPWPERPAGAKAGLDGAFLRVESWFFNGRVTLENQGWFFTKDGRVARTPRGGFEAKAFAAAKQARKTDGVYWIEGDKLFVKWANKAKVEEHKFARKGDDLEIGGLFASRAGSFKKGWRADVSYEGGATASGGGVFVASSSTLTFRRDGTFSRHAIGSASMATTHGTVGGGSAGTADGTYEFEGYTLTLKHAEGREERFTVFGAFGRDSQGAPDHLWREGTMLERQAAK